MTHSTFMAGMPEENVPVYLNNAATTWPKPPEVIAEVSRSLSCPFFEHGRSTLGSAIDYPSATREALAGFFHAENPGHVVFTQNATDALNILIHGFARQEKAPFHAITTDLDHNSVHRPLASLESEGKISLTRVPFAGDTVSLQAIRNAIRPETRLVVMTHGSNVLGSVQDIRPIAEYLAANGIFFIADGAQTVGQIPLDLTAVPAGAFVFTGHKALFGIPGAGGFYIAEPERIAITRQGGTGTDSREFRHPASMPERFEAGTPGYPAIAGLLAGIRFLEREGMDAVVQKTRKITRRFIEGLRDDPAIEIYTPDPALPVVAFNVRGMANDDVGFILAKAYHVITRTGLHCAPLVHERIDGGTGCVRASFSYLTTEDECDTAVAAIREVAAGADR